MRENKLKHTLLDIYLNFEYPFGVKQNSHIDNAMSSKLKEMAHQFILEDNKRKTEHFNNLFDSSRFIDFYYRRLLKFCEDHKIDHNNENFLISLSVIALKNAKSEIFSMYDFAKDLIDINDLIFNLPGSRQPSIYASTYPDINEFLDWIFHEYDYLMNMENVLTVEAKEIKDKLQRNILKPNDPAYIRYMWIAQEMIENNLKKYSAVTSCINHEAKNNKAKFSHESLRRGFDNFLKQNDYKVMEEFNLTQIEFTSIFFPKLK